MWFRMVKSQWGCLCVYIYVQEFALVLLLNSLLKKQFDTQHKMKHVCVCVGKISIIYIEVGRIHVNVHRQN